MDLHRREIVGDGRIAVSDLLERVVVLAYGQTGEDELNLAVLVVLDSLDGINRSRVALI